MAHEKEVQELMEACRRDFLKPGESIYSVKLERVSTPSRSGRCGCCLCDRDFTAFGDVYVLFEYHSYVGEVCLECIAAEPHGTAELVREQAKEAESPDEAFGREFLAHNLELMRDWGRPRLRSSILRATRAY